MLEARVIASVCELRAAGSGLGWRQEVDECLSAEGDRELVPAMQALDEVV